MPDRRQGLQTGAFAFDKFLIHVIPASIAEAMAQNEILQIVVFSIFFGVAMRAVPERAKPILGLVDDLAAVMLKMTRLGDGVRAACGVCGNLATAAKNGLRVLWKLAEFTGGFYCRSA